MALQKPAVNEFPTCILFAGGNYCSKSSRIVRLNTYFTRTIRRHQFLIYCKLSASQMRKSSTLVATLTFVCGVQSAFYRCNDPAIVNKPCNKPEFFKICCYDPFGESPHITDTYFLCGRYHRFWVLRVCPGNGYCRDSLTCGSDTCVNRLGNRAEYDAVDLHCAITNR
jgi:hypothetical protein